MGSGTPPAWQSGTCCLGGELLLRSLLVSPSPARRELADPEETDMASLAPNWCGHSPFLLE